MSTNLQYDKTYIRETLKDKMVVIDNTFLVDLSKDEDKTLLEVLQDLREAGCELLTTPSVVREFARGAKTLSKYEAFEKMITEAGIGVIDIPDGLLSRKAVKQFIVAYSHEANKPSLTDTELTTIAFLFPSSDIRLLSANYRDLPASMLTRENFIAYDMNGEIRTHGFYVIAKNKILEKTLDKYK